MTKDYHRVEKGLALRSPRSKFGADVMARLSTLLPVVTVMEPDAPYARFAEQASQALKQWNAGHGVDSEVAPRSDSFPQPDWDVNFVDTFFNSRKSVRQFDSKRPVSPEVLNRAVGLAATTPSVCNRQPWQVRFYLGDRVQSVLAFQNGNAGFRSEVPCVALITVDTRMFSGASERNQPWIEGGVFAMSLVYALHGIGLQTCMLNMSVLNSQAAAVRSATGLEDAEQIVMMVAIGYAPGDYRVARSPRRNIPDLMQIHM
ncbi:nitroreductase family protein [Pseudarthrobacter sp. AB1]|uniref:nitroreductase family protein n=1 Tax=Pseudarthrobacter sp. AB1 TaxID=2138309 RepID=UPI00186B84B1|nr:nitroreductase family protein [Pseudarthrobacter sp. AB1]